LSDTTGDAPSAGFSVCDCDRYAEHLADISVRRRMVVASNDVRNEFGVLLLARGAPLGHFAFGRMHGHRLNRPVDEALAMRRCLDAAALARRLRELLDSAPDLQRIAAATGLAPRLEALCETAALGPALLQKLSVLEEVLPAVFRRALFCACFGVLLAGERRLDAGEARLLFQAGLLHDLGLLHIDPALATRNAGIGPGEWLEIQRHVPISAAIAERLAAAPARLARVIRGHHERTDGAGYPAGSTSDDIDPLAQILALCDMLHALRFDNPDIGTLSDCMPYLRVNRLVFGEQNYRAAGRILAGARDVAPQAAARVLPRQLLLDTNRSLVALRGGFAALRALLRRFPADPLPASVERLVDQFERVSDASGLGLEAFAAALGESIGADTDEAGLLEIQRTAQELFWLVRRIERQLRALAGATAAGASQRMLRDLAHDVEFELGRAWQRFGGASAPRQERSNDALTPPPLRASLPRR
jgi:hypothetical protein